MTKGKVFSGLAGGMIALGLSAGAASAATTLTFYGDWTSPPPGQQITYDANDDRGSLLCSSSCTGLLSSLPSGVYDPNVPNVSTADGFGSQADLFYISNSGDASELAFVNTVVDPDFASGTKTNTGGVASLSFISDALYILFKIGSEPNYALIQNTSGVAQTYTYTAFAGEGAGMSYVTKFGNVSQIPVPAAGLLLFGALGALVGLRRRQAA